MRVLYISAFFWPHLGGIETLSLKFLPAMQDRGHQFMVITSFANRDLPAHDDHDGILIRRFPFLKAISGRNLPLMRKCIQGMAEVKSTFKPDLVHLQMSAPISYYHVKTLHVNPSPTLLTLHTCFGEFDAGVDTVLGQTLRAANWTTMVSEAVMSDAVKVYPEISKRSSVVYNGMDYAGISPEPLDFSQPCVLGVGRLIRRKGFDILINAFALLRDRFPQAHLLLVGDGTERKILEQQVLDLDLQDSVRFAGQVHPQQVPNLINKADVVVVPSRFPDPLPTVALEAGLLGRPVVAARMGGLGEIIVDGKTGFLVDPESPRNFFEAISYLCSHPQEAMKMGRAARSRIKNVFGWDRYIDSYDTLYHRVANES
ncbi:MAG: glycosyltransferase family 4 protein [Chloroflexi bacterium]|nr:glycosyltransferase family 4 protein [Chloroflexota bacterium]